MKDYKLLIAGLILLLLIICIAVFAWLWSNNRKNIDPLPIMTSENDNVATDDEDNDSVADSTLHIQAEENLQQPLDDVIISFESRYPHIQVLANYVPSTALLDLSTNAFTDNEGARDDFIVDTDIIIANGDLSTERLAPLQATLTAAAQDKSNKAKINNDTDSATVDNDAINEQEQNTKNENQESRTLSSFNYALKDDQALEGVVLTDNATAVNFRNFLLSSTGQGILKKYDYYDIDGYQNSVDDLFNPTSRAKQASGDSSVDIADALSNGK